MKKKLVAVLLVVALVLSFSLVTVAPVTANTDRLVPGTYATIQLAIDAANPGDTIIVADGTYNESLDIGKADLTLKSVNGAGSTTITNAGNVSGTQTGIALRAGADGFVLGGATDEGFTIDGGSAGRLIELINAPAGVEISHNDIDSTGSASMGISVGAAGATGLTITDNSFVAEAGDGSIWGPEVVDIDVSDNTFTGPGGMVSGYAIQFWGVTATSPSEISGNTITGYYYGIVIANGEVTAGLSIMYNTISACKYGIFFYDGVQQGHTAGNMEDVTVKCNTITYNARGLYIWNGVHVLADTFVIECNNFVGNTDYGLRNDNTLSVSAENNWWGHVGGPIEGDAVIGDVDYTPWSYTPDPCEPKSKGFWKNHPDSTDAVLGAYGPVFLGSYEVADATDAEPVFANERAKCAEDMLAPQLLAAELNVLHLTHLDLYDVCEDVDDAIAAADAELDGYNNIVGRCSIGIRKSAKGPVLAIKNVLDDFNNGVMCETCHGCPCDWD